MAANEEESEMTVTLKKNDMMKSSGGCLCGAVRFSLAEAPREIGLCHCGMCRRWGGGLPFAATQAAITMKKDEPLRWWQSSEWGERGFCTVCGSCLFWRSRGAEEGPWMVSVGTLDAQNSLHIAQHIFVDYKADFYALMDEAPRITGAQFTANTLLQLSEKPGYTFDELLDQITKHHDKQFVAEVRRLIEKAKMDR